MCTTVGAAPEKEGMVKSLETDHQESFPGPPQGPTTLYYLLTPSYNTATQT